MHLLADYITEACALFNPSDIVDKGGTVMDVIEPLLTPTNVDGSNTRIHPPPSPSIVLTPPFTSLLASNCSHLPVPLPFLPLTPSRLSPLSSLLPYHPSCSLAPSSHPSSSLPCLPIPPPDPPSTIPVPPLHRPFPSLFSPGPSSTHPPYRLSRMIPPRSPSSLLPLAPPASCPLIVYPSFPTHPPFFSFPSLAPS